MNKYKKRLFEEVNEDATIYELTNEKLKNTEEKALDFIFDSIYSLFEALKNLRKGSAYYLILHGEQEELVEIKKDLSITKYDLKDKRVLQAGKKSFNYRKQKYTLMRRVQ